MQRILPWDRILMLAWGCCWGCCWGWTRFPCWCCCITGPWWWCMLYTICCCCGRCWGWTYTWCRWGCSWWLPFCFWMATGCWCCDWTSLRCCSTSEGKYTLLCSISCFLAMSPWYDTLEMTLWVDMTLMVSGSSATVVNLPFDFSKSSWYLTCDWRRVFSASLLDSGVSVTVVAFTWGQWLQRHCINTWKSRAMTSTTYTEQ